MLGLAQTELAEKAGLSKVQVNQIERGRTLWPGAETRRKLAAALGGFHGELIVAAGEITPEEIVEAANVYDPKRAEASLPFPPASTAARVVELMKGMTDAEVGHILATAEFVAGHRQDGRGGGHGPKRAAG